MATKKESLNPLGLIIKKQWFEQIVAGSKKIEYRDISPFYISRFCINAKEKSESPFSSKVPFIFKEIKEITFFVGYHTNRDSATYEVEKITVESMQQGNFSFDCFHIYLGKQISLQRV